MGIDLNAVEEDEPAGAVCGELWHACAGAGVALPQRGSAVVYLPQAHLAAGGCGDGMEVPAGAAARVPPHVACRVVDVELRVSCPARRAAFAAAAVSSGDLALLVLTSGAVRVCAGGCGDGRGVRAARAGGGGQGECRFHR